MAVSFVTWFLTVPVRSLLTVPVRSLLTVPVRSLLTSVRVVVVFG